MTEANNYLKSLLRNLRTIRERDGTSVEELEERLILGPGWIRRFEEGETVPSIDTLLAILHEIGSSLGDVLEGLPPYPDVAEIERVIFAEQAGNDIVIHFRYAKFDASYTLANATVDQF